MRRNTGCLIGALLPITALVILVYGFHPWFRHRITTKKLTKPNPTSFVFKASVDEIHTVLKKKAVQCCGKVIEFKGYAPFSASILGSPGNENDAYIHNFHEPIGPSAVYFSGENPLPYLCEFHLHMIPVSKGVTRVVVVAYEPEVLDGQSWWGPHNFSPANMYKDVAPTTIEEYRILLELGSALGAGDMPPLLMPTASPGGRPAGVEPEYRIRPLSTVYASIGRNVCQMMLRHILEFPSLISSLPIGLRPESP